MTTHSPECYKWHHECAVAEVERLRAALAQQAEPAAWMLTDAQNTRLRFLEWQKETRPYSGEWIKTPLYTSPPQRKPLTEEEIRALYDQHAAYQEEGPEASGWWAYTRAIEKAHGIE